MRVQAAHGERVFEGGGGCGAGLKGEGVEGGPPGVPAQQLTHFVLVHGWPPATTAHTRTQHLFAAEKGEGGRNNFWLNFN